MLGRHVVALGFKFTDERPFCRRSGESPEVGGYPAEVEPGRATIVIQIALSGQIDVFL